MYFICLHRLFQTLLSLRPPNSTNCSGWPTKIHLFKPVSHTIIDTGFSCQSQIQMENSIAEHEIWPGKWLLKMQSNEREREGVNFLVWKLWPMEERRQGASRHLSLPSSLQKTAGRHDFSMEPLWVYMYYTTKQVSLLRNRFHLLESQNEAKGICAMAFHLPLLCVTSPSL